MTLVQTAKIRVTKWLSSRLPDRLVYQMLIRLSSIPRQEMFREAFRAADSRKAALDIGANRGIVSYFLSKRFPKVHSFEPNSDLARFLEKVLPSNCTLHRSALSDTPGESALAVALVDGIPIHGRGRVADTFTDTQPHAMQKIRLETLDSMGLRDVGLIKIDVEGHEEKVIRGGERTLRENRPVLVVEIEKRHVRKPIREIFSLIESLGFGGHFFENGRKRPISEFEERMQDPDHPPYINDFLFLPR